MTGYQKHLVVVNGLWKGHHPIYLKSFVKILLEASCRDSVLCPKPNELSSWVKQSFSITPGSYKANYFVDKASCAWSYLPVKIRYVTYERRLDFAKRYQEIVLKTVEITR